jgi:aminopeptidase-like protein
MAASEIRSYLERLFPITRSILGDGNRETLQILNEIIPLNIKEYNTGTVVYDWEIPKEWVIRDAWIKNEKGEKIVDYNTNNLHLLNYSIPQHKNLRLAELKNNLHYFIEQPEIIPYRTSYYNENWGFCVSYNRYLELFNEEETYEIYIDSELRNGSLTLADYIVKGETNNEYLFSTYFCHPSMANDNLSGILLQALLARELSNRKLKNTYRFVFVPETIGTITYCAMNEAEMKKIKGGYVLTCLAGQGSYGYKHSFIGNHLVDRLAHQTFSEKQIDFISYPFMPQGSDERQYSSPGFRIPIGSVHKDKYHEYAYYHTSGDNLDYLSIEAMLTTLDIYLSIVDKLEKDTTFISLNPHCEPRLGKRGLYPTIGRRTMYSYKEEGDKFAAYQDELDIIMWLLFYADGKHNLLDIAEKHRFHFDQLHEVLMKLSDKGLIELVNP